MPERALGVTALHFLVCSALVLGAYGVTEVLRGLLHLRLLEDAFGRFTLVYLPHGVLVLMAWFYGWLAVPMVLPSSMLAVYLLRGGEQFGLSVDILVVKALIPPLTFEIFRIAGVDARGAGHALNWRVLVLVGLVAAILSGQVRFWLGCCGALTDQELLRALAGSVTGDMVGLVAAMLAAMFFFRALRQGIR